MNSSDYTTAIIATACWRAAKGELVQVMLSVCQVFQNRAANTGQGVYEVAVQYLDEFPGGFPDTRDPQFQQLLSRLPSVLAGEVADKTGGALWFLPKDQLKPDMLQAFQITTTIGGLVFVK